jgi:hypothetical protein
MPMFKKDLLSLIKKEMGMDKAAFVPSPQMEQQIQEAQQQGVIPPPEEGSQQIGFQELAGMLQEGLGAVMQGQQQIMQMLQQIGGLVQQGAAQGGEGEKKKMSTTDRIQSLEEMVQQLTQAVGGGMGGAPPPEGMPQEGMPPQEMPPEQMAGGQPPMQ